ncbi:KaiC domain-containing protein [Halohasta litorea]|uniref:KaiC domain-containing protein n=1 Tax=Halohasta litorea TaxID=869891 RepID=A0ABD6D689_9EURY|nr:KaiC domain-containing protein [Halohasta litorea]
MSSDWFEEAISELDEEDVEELDDERDTDEGTTDETDDQDSDEETATDTSIDSEAEADTDEEDDVFGFSAAETGGDEGERSDDAPSTDTAADEAAFGVKSEEATNSSSTAQSPEEFGFSSDDGDEGTADDEDADGNDQAVDDAEAADEAPASADDEGTADASEATTADQPQPTSPAGTGEPDTKGPSTAQSPEEFGFSIDGDEETPATTTDTETASSKPQTASTPEPETGGNDDPFGFGDSAGGGSGSGQGMGQSGDDDFGFGGFGGGSGGGGSPTPSSPEDFDDEDFESDIDRIDLGIDGLDEMILGGVPERSLIGIIGGAGTGKTTFALQFLNEALENGERAVFITLEQTEEAVLSTAEEKGWPFREYADNDQLAVVVLDPVEMANSLASIRGDISRLIREFGASRLVLDSVSLLEMMYDHPAKRRSEVFDFTRSLKEAGVTTLLTSEASEDSSHASRYGAVEYLTDAVFVLRYVRTSNFEETRLAIEIQKIRDANHSRATKPYDLTDEGMSVHRQANIF